MTINNQDEREALTDLARNIVNQILDGAVEQGGYVLQDMKKRQAFNDVADAFVTDLLAANFHRTPSPSVVTTVEQCDDWEPNGGPQCAREMGHDGLHSMSKPTSPPPSEVRVTGEQVEAAARAIYEASAYGDSEDMARAAFAAAGIPVAGEES